MKNKTKNKTRYFLQFDRKRMSAGRFWTYNSADDFVIVFKKDGSKDYVSGYNKEEIDDFVKKKKWEEITEAEAALL